MVCNISFACFSAAVTETKNYMILDTACRRSCCGTQWIALQAEKLEAARLKIVKQASQEQFQFGAGAPIKSHEKKAWIPGAIEQCRLVFGANVVDTNIPFLASLRVLKGLGAVIDLTQQVGYFSTLDVTTKLKRVGGHLAIEITQFPAQPHRLGVWTQLADKGFDDPEIATAFTLEHVDEFSTLATMAPLAIRSPSLLSLRDGRQSRAEEAMEEVNQKAGGAGKGCTNTPRPRRHAGR
jgi:hypothetical protein